MHTLPSTRRLQVQEGSLVPCMGIHIRPLNCPQEAGAGEVHEAGTRGGGYPRPMPHPPVLSLGHHMWARKNCLWPEVDIQNRHPKHLIASLPPAILLPLTRCCPPWPAMPQPCAPIPVGSGFLLLAVAKPSPPILYIFGLGYNCDSQCGPTASTILLQGTISSTSQDHTPKCTPTPNPSPKACCHL